ncbi:MULTISPECIES: bifunctional phosphatase PAP2/diacylglycerol kinase family protein [Streptomyces]|uniref:Phosphatase PAP2 family protein n=1 Tax=Streptomyces koelreuteriae TaxID=2838015 RepID=A0ABX8FLM5_9ACTN|nr:MULTISPECIES: bifunctional phosphatase PAP2/diacylglycerol kinase family protein [Streptomyces]QWB22048.1 phosphatase PAP2 family protein [Streptomyces koelreuteriae]UUA04981.1 phosphatase PAP2 family protein [Streptomyces koelreuteriae]UUA12605.1 phosphatase PAP2 family protein [Streptomyces sp. CRCS-T-1]
MTTPDLDLTTTKPGHHPLRDGVLTLDRRLFEAAAHRHWPGAGPVLPRLGRSANHGVLWCVAAAALAASRTPRARRAATRGLASLGLASLAVNTLGKRSVRRSRPALDPVPLIRRLGRQPITTSFPSGHAASAAAFATGVALESPAWGAVVAPVAASVALSRVYTGAHFPSDVLAGAALGAGAAFAVRGLVPTRSQAIPPARPRAEVPALLEGEGLVLVANTAAGTAERARALRDELPRAEVVECAPQDVAAALEEAAGRARVLGVCGGDGTVNTAARVALKHRLPLAVLPGGTLNHFAYDLGVEDARDLARALRQGDAVRVDVGRFSCGERHGVFLNTCSVGVYPELVRERERWSHRIGGWPAGLLAARRVLRADRHPLEAEFRGRTRPLWLLFAGNGTYHRVGLAPGRRLDLADGQLDVRVVHGGRRPAARLLAAALAGPLTRSPAHAAVQVGRLRLDHVAPGTLLAYDGEVIDVEGRVTLEKLPEALTVYRPVTGY